MYMPEIDRLNLKKMGRTHYQADRRARNDKYAEGRIAQRRAFSQQQKSRIKNLDHKREQRTNNKLMMKGAKSLLYEHVKKYLFRKII